jgi:hypothetical protein
MSGGGAAGERIDCQSTASRSAETRQHPSATERSHQLGSPRPAPLQPHNDLSGVTDDPSSGVQQPVPQRFRLGFGKLALQTDQLRPAQQILCSQNKLDPHLVTPKISKRQVG